MIILITLGHCDHDLVLFGGAIFMVLGLSLEKFHEARAETLPGGGWGVRRHCLERRARASSNFASSGPHPSEGHSDNAGRNGEGDPHEPTRRDALPRASVPGYAAETRQADR